MKRRNEIDRERINQDIRDYLSAGGQITEVPRGETGMRDYLAPRTQKQVRDAIRNRDLAKAGMK